jgi:flagellar basal body-associated protein FliL
VLCFSNEEKELNTMQDGKDEDLDYSKKRKKIITLIIVIIVLLSTSAYVIFFG